MSGDRMTGNDGEIKETNIQKTEGEDPQTEQGTTHCDKKKNPSPTVENIKWGCIDVERFGKFKDVKLYPGGAEAWDWSKTDTHHQPGILEADVIELLEHGCKIIILSRGMEEMLHTSKKTLQLLKDKQMKENKDYFIVQSEKAVELYNKYAKRQERVGALIHSTC